MIEEQKISAGSPANEADPPSKRSSVNSLTIFLVLAFLLILLAESVAASSLTNGIDAPVAINYTKEFKTCVALGKSEEKCNKTATAWAKETPTPKECYPYKAGRAVKGGETFDQYVSFYKMTDEQRDEFIKINGLSPAYPKTIIYVGVKYCLPYGVNKKAAEGTDDDLGFNPSADFGWQVTYINGWEITFELINFERYDKVNVFFWKKPPGASYWRCRTGSDESCADIMYRDKEVFSDGYAEDRKIWLGQFKVPNKRNITLSFPQEVTGWNQVYVCMHSLFRDEADTDPDKGEYYASYHNYCQLINLDRKITTRIVRDPAPTTTWNFPTATLPNTPCAYVYHPYCRPVGGGFWDTTTDGIVCGLNTVYEDPAYVCQAPCYGTRLPTPENTACPILYPEWAHCPGTRLPYPGIKAAGVACTPVCMDLVLDPAGAYHVDPIVSPTWDLTRFPTVTPCHQWWVTPKSSR